MRQYLNLLDEIMTNGIDKPSRAGDTRGLFGYQMRFDLQEGFPLLTTKKLSFKNIAVELLWFLRGDTNIKYLLENDCHIWSADAFRVYMRARLGWKGNPDTIQDFEACILENPDFAARWGDLGPIYGKQWRDWQGLQTFPNGSAKFIPVDQIKNVIESIRKDPNGRRHIISSWNPAEIDSMALPPCHCLCQFYVSNDRLSCHLYQRSADSFLGVPFNIASYALLTHIIAHQTGLGVGDFVHSFGDVHIYHGHFGAVREILDRSPGVLPTLSIGSGKDATHDPAVYILEDFHLEGYNPQPAIKAELQVGV